MSAYIIPKYQDPKTLDFKFSFSFIGTNVCLQIK